MRIILSRKGFDSSAGGCPSPIFPDGRLCSLPIPDPESSISYADIEQEGINLGELLVELTGDREWPHRGAHLDPDLRADALPRRAGWRPLLGQSGSAQGHLRNEGVVPGDLFLFFGSFRPVQRNGNGWRFVAQEPPRQLIWGWMRIGAVHQVDALPGDALPWARYHPHFAYAADSSNTLYLATDKLELNGLPASLPGAGVFRQLDERLMLTAPGARLQTRWRLPGCFAPVEGRQGLSFHRNPSRWTADGEHYLLDSAFRGQEFVFDAGHGKALREWLARLPLQS